MDRPSSDARNEDLSLDDAEHDRDEGDHDQARGYRLAKAKEDANGSGDIAAEHWHELGDEDNRDEDGQIGQADEVGANADEDRDDDDDEQLPTQEAAHLLVERIEQEADAGSIHHRRRAAQPEDQAPSIHEEYVMMVNAATTLISAKTTPPAYQRLPDPSTVPEPLVDRNSHGRGIDAEALQQIRQPGNLLNRVGLRQKRQSVGEHAALLDKRRPTK